MTSPLHFEIEPIYRRIILLSPWIMVALVMLCVALPFLPDAGKPLNGRAVARFSIGCGTLFGIAAVLYFRVVRRLPEAAITIDEEGIWPSIKSRDTALVRWDRVVRVREREILQRLDLIDRSGVVLAKIEYELRDFSHLHATVLARASLEQTARSMRDVHRKPAVYHIVYVALLTGCAFFGWFADLVLPAVASAGLTLMVAVFAWEYATTPFRIRLTPHHLEVDWPLRRKIVPREAVTAIEIDNQRVNHATHMKVIIRTLDAPGGISLAFFGLSATELHQGLRAWLADDG